MGRDCRGGKAARQASVPAPALCSAVPDHAREQPIATKTSRRRQRPNVAAMPLKERCGETGGRAVLPMHAPVWDRRVRSRDRTRAPGDRATRFADDSGSAQPSRASGPPAPEQAVAAEAEGYCRQRLAAERSHARTAAPRRLHRSHANPLTQLAWPRQRPSGAVVDSNPVSRTNLLRTRLEGSWI